MLVEANSAPDHNAGSTPCVDLQHVVDSESLVSSPPYSDSSVASTYAETAFVSEDDVSPLSPGPVQVLLGPRQAVLPVSQCEDRTPQRTSTLQPSFSKSVAHCLSSDGSAMIANGVSGSFNSRQEAVSKMIQQKGLVLAC